MDIVAVLDTICMAQSGALAIDWEVSVGVEMEVVLEEDPAHHRLLGLRQDMEELEDDKLNHYL